MIGEWRQIPPDAFQGLEELAAGRDALSAEADNTYYWADHFNLRGACGEWHMEQETGIPMNREIKIRDGGTDFPGMDVKSTKWVNDPWLRVLTSGVKARVYACVSLDLEGRRTRLDGYATRGMVLRAPTRVLNQDEEPSHILTVDQLVSADVVLARLLGALEESL